MRTDLGHLVLERRKDHGKDGLAVVLKEQRLLLRVKLCGAAVYAAHHR